MLLRKFLIEIKTRYKDDGFKAADKSIRNLDKSSKRAARSVGQLDRALDKAGNEAAKTGRKTAKAGRDAKKSGQSARGASANWGKLAGSVKSLGPVAAGVGRAMAAAATGVVAVGAGVIKVGTDFESLRARLKTVEGGSEQAAKAFEQIQDFTKSTPFQLDQVTEAYVRLKSLGLDANKESMLAFGNIAAAQGKDIIDIIEAAADASTGEFERLKEFGIKASSQGDRVSFTFKGMTTTVGKNAEEIQGYLKSLGETEFAGAMTDQMATARGMLSNLQDGFMTFLDTVAQMGVLDEFKGLLGDLSGQFGEGDGMAKILADSLVRVIKAIRESVQSITREDVEGAFTTFQDVAKGLATAIDAVVSSIRFFIDISGGFEGAMVNVSLGAIALTAAFTGPAGLVVAAAAVGAAVGNMMNAFGASDALADFISQFEFLNKRVEKFLNLVPGAFKNDEPRVGRGVGAGLYGGDIKKTKTTKTDTGPTFTLEGAMEAAQGKGAGRDPAIRKEATKALEQYLAGDIEENRQASVERANKTISDQKKKKGKGKKKSKFFDFDKDVKNAARSQAEEFAQRELERLIASGIDPDEAVSLARQAGESRANELEKRFKQAGKIFDASASKLLDALDLSGPGSILEGRPPPQTLLITIAPIIKLVETMTITVQGASSPEQERALTDAANQARDAIYAKIEELPALIDDQFRLRARALQTVGGRGRSGGGIT